LNWLSRQAVFAKLRSSHVTERNMNDRFQNGSGDAGHGVFIETQSSGFEPDKTKFFEETNP